jgi:hypothetical protein
MKGVHSMDTPFAASNRPPFGTDFAKWAREAGLPDHCRLHGHELQMVAAMTEAMKEEYWRRKAAGGEDLARVKPPSKLPMLLWWVFVFGPLLWAFWKVWGALLFGSP